MGNLALEGRYFRTRPMNNTGFEFESVNLDPEKTAFVGMHCWNIGCEDGPAIDLNFPVGMGSLSGYAEADHIMKTMIAPGMEMSRNAGVLVCHVENQYIGLKDERAQIDMDKEELAEVFSNSPEQMNDSSRAVVPGWSKQIHQRFFGDYLENPPFSEMNRAEIVAPKPGDVYVFQTGQMDRALRKNGIENLIYTGFAMDHCVLRAPGGAEAMFLLGYRTYLLRDATLGAEYEDTFEDRLHTNWGVRYFETHLGDTFQFANYMQACEKVLGNK
jgi:nicotinamidase-related amidase